MSQPEVLSRKEAGIQKRRVLSLVNRWKKIFLLGHWEIKIIPENEVRGDGDKSSYHPQDVNGYWECVMSTSSDPYYMQASIFAYLPIIKDLNDKRLEEALVHEFMHIYLSPMTHTKHKKEEELVATTLARTFVRLREGGDKKSRRSNNPDSYGQTI
jgi:hypothetical protein